MALGARRQTWAGKVHHKVDGTNDDVTRWRAETPGCANCVHLNNAGASLMPSSVLETVVGHLRREAGHGGYESADDAAGAVRMAYEHVARLLGCEARNVAVVQNATVAFSQALSAFDLRRGDVIVTTRNDYISNQLAFLSLRQRRGVEVQRADDLPGGGVDPDSLGKLARNPRCRLVAVTWVPTNSGLVQPVEAVGEICQAAGVPYLIDACQAAGQIPIDVGKLRCDFLSATARKFLRGPRGVGFLYVSDGALKKGLHPLHIDMRGAKWVEADAYELFDDARRFENWEFASALLLGLGEAARYAGAIGIEEAGRRARQHAVYVREKLGGIEGLRVLDRGAELCAIVTVEVRGWDAPEVVRRLRQRHVNTSASLRGHALLDMDEKHAASAVRISPHYFNTTGELDTVVAALEEIRRQPCPPPGSYTPPQQKA